MNENMPEVSDLWLTESVLADGTSIVTMRVDDTVTILTRGHLTGMHRWIGEWLASHPLKPRPEYQETFMSVNDGVQVEHDLGPALKLHFTGLVEEGVVPSEAWQRIVDDCRSPRIRALFEDMKRDEQGREMLATAAEQWRQLGLPVPWEWASRSRGVAK